MVPEAKAAVVDIALLGVFVRFTITTTQKASVIKPITTATIAVMITVQVPENNYNKHLDEHVMS